MPHMWVQNDIVNAIGLKEGNNKQKSFIQKNKLLALTLSIDLET